MQLYGNLFYYIPMKVMRISQERGCDSCVFYKIST